MLRDEIVVRRSYAPSEDYFPRYRREGEKSPVAIEADAVEWAAGALGFVADEKQAGFLRSGARRGILNCSRQWGKSTVTAVKALHTALRQQEALVLVMSPSRRQSGEFLRKVEELLRKLKLPVQRDGVNELSLLLPGRSRMVGLPGVEATMRGFSAADLLIFDEAARVRDEQYYAAGAVLAVKHAPLWLLSTPFGARGFFWREWVQGGETWERITVKGEECGRIAPEFLEEEKRRLGRDWFRQEYGCEFVGAEGQAFQEEWLEKAWVEAPDLF